MRDTKEMSAVINVTLINPGTLLFFTAQFVGMTYA